MPDEWNNDITQCVDNGFTKNKVEFKIYTNFSNVQHLINKKLETQGSISVQEIQNNVMSFELSDICIKGAYHLNGLCLHENKYQEGIWDVELTFKMKVDVNALHEKFSHDLGEAARILSEYLVNLISFSGFSVKLIPSSIWGFVSCHNEWQKVVQIGESSLPPVSCDQNSISAFIEKLPDITKSLNEYTENKKFSKLLDILKTGLRLEWSQLWRDAYLNYYSIIETIFRDNLFRSKLILTLKKPTVYKNALGNCNQRFQMLFLWEFFCITYPEDMKHLKIEDFDLLADKRNDLTHDGTTEIQIRHIILVKFVMFHLLNEFGKLVTEQ